MKTSRTLAILLCLCMMAGVLTGCGSKSAAPTETAAPAAETPAETAAPAAEPEAPAAPAMRTITDLEGREVTIPENVESVIAIPWPWTSIVFAVDGTEEHIASMSATAKKSYENCLFKTLAPGLGDTDSGYVDDAGTGGVFGTVNFEEMANIDPDLVVLYKANAGDLPNYEAIGVPAVIVNYGTLEQVHKGIRLLGEIFHKEDRAEKIIAYHENTEAAVAELVRDIPEEEKPSVLYLYNSSLMTQPIGFPGWMIEEAGGVNAGGTLEITGDNTSGFVAMDMEKIYAMDPDIIIMSNFDPFTPEQIYNNEIADADWSQLKAVQNHRVYKIPMGIYRWSQPNVEAHLFLEWLGKLTQPEAFAEVDLKADTIEFYKTMFNYDLSEAELDQLYRTAMNETANIW